jgi:hypothetical protein
MQTPISVVNNYTNNISVHLKVTVIDYQDKDEDYDVAKNTKATKRSILQPSNIKALRQESQYLQYRH